MAPYIAALPAYHSLPLSDKNGLKLRKPLVEKMRRDRINSCIEQLKSLLEREFHSQDPNAKLEKADILEMTVSFLKRQRLQLSLGPARTSGQMDYSQGYSQCWRESVQFLTVSSCRGAAVGEHHSPPKGSPRDLSSALSYSPSSPPSFSSSCSPSTSSPSTSVSFVSSPVTSKQNLVSVIHHAMSKRPVWRPW